jgi:hypothetical protein
MDLHLKLSLLHLISTDPRDALFEKPLYLIDCLDERIEEERTINSVLAGAVEEGDLTWYNPPATYCTGPYGAEPSVALTRDTRYAFARVPVPHKRDTRIPIPRGWEKAATAGRGTYGYLNPFVPGGWAIEHLNPISAEFLFVRASGQKV